MIARVSRRQWLMRDVPRTGILFVWLAFAASVAFYASDWPRGGQEKPVAVRPSANQVAGNAERYSGSIIIAARADDCWQRMLDNRNGKMWDVGLVNCMEAMAQTAPELQADAYRTKRLRAIGKAFGSEN